MAWSSNIFCFLWEILSLFLLWVLLSAPLSINYFWRPNMSRSEYSSIIESCLSELASIKSILQCKIKFKLIAFHDSLDNQKLKACMSKMANWSMHVTTVLSMLHMKAAALHTLTPCFKSWRSTILVLVDRSLVWGFSRLLPLQSANEDSTLTLVLSLHPLQWEEKLCVAKWKRQACADLS